MGSTLELVRNVRFVGIHVIFPGVLSVVVPGPCEIIEGGLQVLFIIFLIITCNLSFVCRLLLPTF